MKRWVRSFLLLLVAFPCLASSPSRINPIKFTDAHRDNSLRAPLAGDRHANLF